MARRLQKRLQMLLLARFFLRETKTSASASTRLRVSVATAMAVLMMVASVAAQRPPRATNDETLARLLATSAITSVERGRGGRSLGFRVTLEGGVRAYFKPEQTFSGMHWYAEVAGHHLDRAIGTRRTPVATSRRVAWSVIEGAAGDDPRRGEIIVAEDGTVRGAMIAWIEGRLVPLRAPIGWERWLAIEAPAALSPFVRPRGWYEQRDAGAATPVAARETEAPNADRSDRPAELSDLVVFDYLVHNTDRWSENWTNVRTREERGPLVFLDQGAGFSPRRARLELMDARLASVHRFRRNTIDAVRALDVDRLAARLGTEALAPILDERQLVHLEERRVALLAHVDACIAEHGEAAVLPW